MFFKNVRLSQTFFSNRKINRIENNLASRLNEEQSYLFLDFIAKSPRCNTCKERFYSEAGLKEHLCR